MRIEFVEKRQVFVGFGIAFTLAFIILVAFSSISPPIYADNTEGMGQDETPDSPFMTEYPIAGSPLNIAVEAPGRLWVTIPASNTIGSLVVTSTTIYTFTSYVLPTAQSEPYDLVYDAPRGIIWFTQRQGNRIGRFDISTKLITDYTVPTPDSKPMGIALAPNGLVWFVENGANRIASLNPTTATFHEYEYTPRNLGNANLTDIAVQSDNAIWFTAPGDHDAVKLVPAANAFVRSLVGPTSRPLGITIDPDGRPWITEAVRSNIGWYGQGTLTNWGWIDIPSKDEELVNLYYDSHQATERIWYVHYESGKVGRLSIARSLSDSRPIEQSVFAPGSQPWGIVADASGDVWIALGGRNSIVGWRPPYFQSLFLAFISQPKQE